MRLRVVEERPDWTDFILRDLEIGINDLQHLRSPVVVPCTLWGRRAASGCCPTIGPTVIADTFSPFHLSMLRVDKQSPGSVLGAGARPFIKAGKHSHRVNLLAAAFEAMQGIRANSIPGVTETFRLHARTCQIHSRLSKRRHPPDHAAHPPQGASKAPSLTAVGAHLHRRTLGDNAHFSGD